MKSDKKSADITPLERNIMTTLFKSQIPHVEKSEFIVGFEAISGDSHPIVITQSEYMRRMKEMAALQPGMSFYGDLPDSYNLTLNTDHPVVKKVMDAAEKALGEKIEPLEKELESVNKAIEETRKKGSTELTEENKKEIADNEKKAGEIRKQQSDIITEYANNDNTVKQLVDIALLGNGLLKGEDLNNFLKRTVDLL